MGSSSALPSEIAGYRIERLLGEGASSRVYLAREARPERRVALKVLHHVTEHGRERFRRETELLAGLEHPGIARLYAAGENTVGGAPVLWIAMAYIEGTTLRDWAKQRRPSQTAMMDLLRQVADTAHAAHTRGVIHRDLKPDNVIVRDDDTPCIVDFGIAHATRESDAQTRMTQAGQVLGTLPYMSTEQLLGDRVDPRCDVFAIGVMAYELLSGQLPHPGLANATLLSALETVRLSQAKPLSSLVTGVDSDLHTIVHKAMAYEADQRYASAAELASDIGRWLQRLPIEARRPTASYVVGLFVRRHKALSAAAGLTALALIAASAISINFAVKERSANQLAQERLAQREAVSNLMSDMLADANPYQTQGEQITVLDVLDKAAARLQRDDSVPPAVRAGMWETLGKTYVALGRANDGVDAYARALELLNQVDQAEPTAITTLYLGLAEAQTAAGQEEAAFNSLRTVDERLSGSAENAELQVTAALRRSTLLRQTGAFVAAEKTLRPAYELAESAFSPDNELRVETGIALAAALHRQSKLDEALTLAGQLETLSIRHHGPAHPLSLSVQQVHALALREAGKIDAALEKFNVILDTLTAMLGDQHFDVAGARMDVAATLSQAGRAGEALPVARRAHETVVQRIGPDNDLARTITALRASVASYADAFDEAIPLFESLLAYHESKPGGPTANDLIDYNNLATAYKLNGQIDQAVDCFQTLLNHGERVLGRDHAHFGIFESNYGEALRVAGAFDMAEQHLEHALQVTTATLGADHPTTRATDESLAQVRAELRVMH